jgi:hypothetical protein
MNGWRIFGIIVWGILFNILAAVLGIDVNWRVILLVVVMSSTWDVIWTLTEPEEKASDPQPRREP